MNWCRKWICVAASSLFQNLFICRDFDLQMTRWLQRIVFLFHQFIPCWLSIPPPTCTFLFQPIREMIDCSWCVVNKVYSRVCWGGFRGCIDAPLGKFRSGCRQLPIVSHAPSLCFHIQTHSSLWAGWKKWNRIENGDQASTEHETTFALNRKFNFGQFALLPPRPKYVLSGLNVDGIEL